jgi:hypothetical protein
MSSPSAPIETTLRHSPIPLATPSIVLVPDNTPERPLTPQLARRTEPFDKEVASTFGRLSTIDYNQPEEEEDPYCAPPGFIPNSCDGRLFYPVYVKDSNYDTCYVHHRRLPDLGDMGMCGFFYKVQQLMTEGCE